MFCLVRSTFGQFEVPDALVEVFRPRGLRVSIPDQEGIKLFAFHGKINEEMNGREGGTFSRDILKAKNGRWTFYDANARLKEGDILYYWTYVDYFDGKNKLGYPNDDQKFVVKQLLDKDGAAPSVTSPTVTTAPPQEHTTLESGCKASVTTKVNERVCAGEQIFHEDFTTFETNIWRPEVKFADKPDYEFVFYRAGPPNLQVKHHRLTIRPVPSDAVFGEGFVSRREKVNLAPACTGVHGSIECVQTPGAFLILPPVTSAQISTKGKWSFKYGKVEIRAKLPKGDWIYPELYLNPVNEEYGPGYASGQIRIAFSGGNEDLCRDLRGGCILGSSPAARNYAVKNIVKNSGSWSDDFHKFIVIWKPDQITMMVDDQVYGNIYPPEGGFVSEAYNLDLVNVERWRGGTSFAPFDKEMYLVLGVGVGGHCFEDRSDATKPWTNNDPKSQKKFYQAAAQWGATWSNASRLEVDYVKVWAL
jgi:hypothetical protein